MKYASCHSKSITGRNMRSTNFMCGYIWMVSVFRLSSGQSTYLYHGFNKKNIKTCNLFKQIQLQPMQLYQTIDFIYTTRKTTMA